MRLWIQAYEKAILCENFLPVDFLVLRELSSLDPVVFASVGEYRVIFHAIDLIDSADVAVLDVFISLEFQKTLRLLASLSSFQLQNSFLVER